MQATVSDIQTGERYRKRGLKKKISWSGRVACPAVVGLHSTERGQATLPDHENTALIS
jgi:hypothetical protein